MVNFSLPKKAIGEHSMPAPQKEPSRPAKVEKEPAFVNPRLDWGFKRLLSDEAILLDFLNSLLPLQDRQLASAQLVDKEHQGETRRKRTVIFDVHAIGQDKTAYIIEIQQAYQDYFTNRSQYYVAREISAQGKQGDWDYHLSPVSLIAILDFKPHHDWVQSEYLYHFKPLGLTTHIELDNLWSISMVVLPLVPRKWQDCSTRSAKWCYLLKNLGCLTAQQAEIFRSDPIFGRVTEVMEIAALTDQEREMLTRAQLDQADEFAVMQCARRESREEGKELGRLEADVAHYQDLLDFGLTDDQICKALKWDSAKLNTIKRAATSPKLELNQDNQANPTVE